MSTKQEFGYDAADPDVIDRLPGDSYAVFGYVGPVRPDNKYVTFPEVQKRFGNHAHCGSIAVHDEYDAQWLDCERFDAVPSQFPAWYFRQRKRGEARPGGYAAEGEMMPELLQVIDRMDLKREEYGLWVAAYPGSGANVQAPYDIHQFTNHGPSGENYDVNAIRPGFYDDTKHVDPQAYLKYHQFPVGPFPWKGQKLNERAIVQRYDLLRGMQTHVNHPHRTELTGLREKLEFLAKRVAHEMILHHPPGKRLDTTDNFWGWRYQQLLGRSRGQRFTH